MTEEKANKIIENIELVDLLDDDAYDKVYKILNTQIGKMGTFAFDLNYHPDLFYCRARIMKNVKDYFDEISDHSYNPKLNLIKMGRANIKEQQILYLGRTRPTALAEVNIIENQKDKKLVSYGISRWQPIKQLKIVAVVDPTTIDQIEADEIRDLQETVRTVRKELIKTNQNGYLKLYEYFGSKFRELIVKGEEHKYKITSAFSNMVFDLNKNIDGIMYQSVKLPQYYNLAIKKDKVDEYYFKPSHFVKNIYERENITKLKDVAIEVAKSFDESKNTIEWEYSL